MLVLKAARLIDGTGSAAVQDAEVHVDGKAIVYAGPSREAPPVPGNPQIVDLGQRTLLPGLIDCHAHPVSYGGEAGAASADWADELRVLYATDAMKKALLSGVTTIRNTGSPRNTAYSLKAAVDAGKVAGPRL